MSVRVTEVKVEIVTRCPHCDGVGWLPVPETKPTTEDVGKPGEGTETSDSS